MLSFLNCLFADIPRYILDHQVWKIKDRKLINNGTGREYLYDTSKQGYDLDGVIIEERYIKDYLKTSQNKWKFCQEDDKTFKIKCSTTGNILRAKSHYDKNRIILGM